MDDAQSLRWIGRFGKDGASGPRRPGFVPRIVDSHRREPM
jgi:hypothetical protein